MIGPTSQRTSGVNRSFEGLGELGAGLGDGSQGGAEGIPFPTGSMPGSTHPQAER